MFDPISAVAIGAGSLLGGVFGQKAADTQADAARDAARMQQQQYQQSRQDMMPWMRAGGRALGQLEGRMGDLTSGFAVSPEDYYRQASQKFAFDPASDPSYQWRLKQGQEAVEKSAAARGGFFSGQTGKELAGYGQGMASQEYQSAFDRDLASKRFGTQAYGTAFTADQARKQSAYNMLSGLAGTGQVATRQLSSLGQQSAAAQGQYGQQAAGAQAGAIQNWGGQIQSGLGNLAQYQMLNNLYKQPPATNYSSDYLKRDAMIKNLQYKKW